MGKFMLCKVDFRSDHIHVRDWKTKGEKHEYITRKATETKTYKNFIIKNSEIQVPFTYNETCKYNYIAYSNDNKTWEYAHFSVVTPNSLVGGGITTIQLAYDFHTSINYKLGKCYTEREFLPRYYSTNIKGKVKPRIHPISDVPAGDLYASERKELGELLWLVIAYIPDKVQNDEEHGYFIKTSTEIYPKTEKTCYACVPFKTIDTGYLGCSSVEELLKSDLWDSPSVLGAYITPYVPISESGSGSASYIFYRYKSGATEYACSALSPTTDVPLIKRIEKIYLPTYCGLVSESVLNSSVYKESKLLSSPYFLVRTTLENSKIEVPLDRLTTYTDEDKPYLALRLEISLSLDGANIFYTYDTQEEGEADSISQGVKIGKQLPLYNESYTNYIFSSRESYKNGLRNSLMQQGVNFALTAATGGATIAGTAGQLANAGFQALAIHTQRTDLKQQPTQIRGTSEAADAFSNLISPRICTYFLEQRDADMRAVEGYYTRYGYKVLKNKVPFTKNRYYFNYVKTIDAVIKNCEEEDDYNSLRDMYDRGVTIWHVYKKGDEWIEAEIGDYSVDNYDTTKSFTDSTTGPETPDDYGDTTGGLTPDDIKNGEVPGSLIPYKQSMMVFRRNKNTQVIEDMTQRAYYADNVRRTQNLITNLFTETGFYTSIAVSTNNYENIYVPLPGAFKVVERDYTKGECYYKLQSEVDENVIFWCFTSTRQADDHSVGEIITELKCYTDNQYFAKFAIAAQNVGKFFILSELYTQKPKYNHNYLATAYQSLGEHYGYPLSFDGYMKADGQQEFNPLLPYHIVYANANQPIKVNNKFKFGDLPSGTRFNISYGVVNKTIGGELVRYVCISWIRMEGPGYTFPYVLQPQLLGVVPNENPISINTGEIYNPETYVSYKSLTPAEFLGLGTLGRITSAMDDGSTYLDTGVLFCPTINTSLNFAAEPVYGTKEASYVGQIEAIEDDTTYLFPIFRNTAKLRGIHEGVEYFTCPYQNVYSPTDCTVIEVNRISTAGINILLDCGAKDGKALLIRLGVLGSQGIAVREGDKIRKGSIIAKTSRFGFTEGAIASPWPSTFSIKTTLGGEPQFYGTFYTMWSTLEE